MSSNPLIQVGTLGQSIWLDYMSAGRIGDQFRYAGVARRGDLRCASVRGGFAVLGIELDESRNKESAAINSTDTSRATVRVIRTDEELMIARSVYRILGIGTEGKES